jgi:hypothetical protein
MNKSVSTQDSLKASLSGRLQVYSIPSDKKFPMECLGDPVIDHENLVVNGASTVLSKLLQRSFSEYMPRFITLGSGGDLEQLSKVDSGSRVAPAVTDDSMREVIARLPIILVDPDETAENTWTYVAIARPVEALSAIINEFGVESENETLISHFVTATLPGESRSEKFSKSSLEYLVIRWTFTLNLN